MLVTPNPLSDYYHRTVTEFRGCGCQPPCLIGHVWIRIGHHAAPVPSKDIGGYIEAYCWTYWGAASVWALVLMYVGWRISCPTSFPTVMQGPYTGCKISSIHNGVFGFSSVEFGCVVAGTVQ